MKDSPPSYRATWWLQLVRPRQLIDVPMVESGWITRAGHAIRLTEAKRSPRVIDASVNDTAPRFLSTMLQEAADGYSWFGYMRRRGPRLLAINGELRTVIAAQEEEARTVTVNGVEIRWRRAWVDAPWVVRGGARRWIETWLDGATLGMIAVEQAATIERTLAVDPYVLGPPP